MSAAVSLPPAIDWRTVAPEDWQYLGDLLPAPRLVVLPAPPAKARELAPAQYEAIRDAARVVGARRCFRLTEDERCDLEQDLALRFLQYEEPIANLKAWLRLVAERLVIDRKKAEASHDELLEERHALGADRPYRGPFKRDPMVNYMAAKRPDRNCGLNDVEDAMHEAIIERDRLGIGRPRTPTCPQDRIAEREISAKRAPAYKSTSKDQKTTRTDRIGSSSS